MCVFVLTEKGKHKVSNAIEQRDQSFYSIVSLLKRQEFKLICTPRCKIGSKLLPLFINKLLYEFKSDSDFDLLPVTTSLKKVPNVHKYHQLPPGHVSCTPFSEEGCEGPSNYH